MASVVLHKLHSDCIKIYDESNVAVKRPLSSPPTYFDARERDYIVFQTGPELFLSVAWPTGVQLLVFFCSSVPVMLFGTPGISGCRSQHVPVESSSLLHHSIYL